LEGNPRRSAATPYTASSQTSSPGEVHSVTRSSLAVVQLARALALCRKTKDFPIHRRPFGFRASAPPKRVAYGSAGLRSGRNPKD